MLQMIFLRRKGKPVARVTFIICKTLPGKCGQLFLPTLISGDEQQAVPAGNLLQKGKLRLAGQKDKVPHHHRRAAGPAIVVNEQPRRAALRWQRACKAAGEDVPPVLLFWEKVLPILCIIHPCNLEHLASLLFFHHNTNGLSFPSFFCLLFYRIKLKKS